MHMKTVMLMRHAKSDWKQPGLSDHDRPLNARGRAAAPLMANHLQAEQGRPDIILASSAVRVQQTLELMQPQWDQPIETLSSRDLYLSSPQQIIDSLRGLHDVWDSVLLVGHNPGIAGVASHWSGGVIEMPTAAVAVFQYAQPQWRTLSLTSELLLVAYWKPHDLM